jgi:outer membrane murein-binding lipoprotein Lpp
MKNQIVIVLLLAAAMIGSVVLSGCSAPPMTWGAPGLTSKQVDQRHYEAIQTDLWQLQDDIDAFFLFDRPGRMHRLPVR